MYIELLNGKNDKRNKATYDYLYNHLTSVYKKGADSLMAKKTTK